MIMRNNFISCFIGFGLMLISNNAVAQSKNFITIVGLSYDALLKSEYTASPTLQNKIAYDAKYTRAIGSHVALGLMGQVFIRDGEYRKFEITDKDTKGYFLEKGHAFGYNTRYYFTDVAAGGMDDGFFIEFSYSYAMFTQLFDEVYGPNPAYNPNSWSYTNDRTIRINAPDSKYNVHRYGAKVGVVGTTGGFDEIPVELYLGVYYNNVVRTDLILPSPTRVLPLSFVVGYNFGFSF
jgi:hypothetical protein